MKLQGRVWILDDDDINTDVIYPGKYTYEPFGPEEMASHALEDFDPSFATSVAEGDIIVAGRNFGCGSSREQAVTCLKAAGVAAVVAGSFARIWYRNAINQALVAIESPEAAAFARERKVDLERKPVSLDTERGRLTIGGEEFDVPPLSGKALEIFEAGGLVPYTRSVLGVE